MLQLYEYLLSKGIERRRVQEKFFHIVLSAIEEGEGTVKVIQAPTGTGKTYGYLMPLIEKGQKAIISTGTKVLQEQLRKDLETLRAHYNYLTGREVNYLVIKGKSNYLCLDRYYSMPVEKRPVELEFAIDGSWDGDFEFINIDDELREKLCVEDDYCTSHYRNVCKFRQDCYYWSRLKRLERSADLLVVNHALLSLKEFENPEERVLVLDEAHELDKYLTNSLGSGVSLYTIRQEIMGRVLDFLRRASLDEESFFVKHFEPLLKDREEMPVESLQPYAEDFGNMIVNPVLSFHKEIKEKLIAELSEFILGRMFVSLKFKDYLLKAGLLEWEKYLQLQANYEEPSEEEERWIGKLKSYELLKNKVQKLVNFHKLMSRAPEGIGYLVGRKYSRRLNTFNYWMEAFPIFPAGHVDFSGYRAVLVTSATVDPEDIKQTIGIEGEYYELDHTFPYHRVSFMVYMADPRRKEEWEECIRHAYRYLRSLYERVLVLLTNKEHRRLFEREEGVAFQGDEGLSSLISSLKDGRLKALVGFDSLWFGIDVKGEKGILMSKLPFESPEDPITFHRIRFLKNMGLDPFEYQKRKALIKFRQGVGRLMRSKDDAGTIVLCDKRIFKFREFLGVLANLGVEVRTRKISS